MNLSARERNQLRDVMATDGRTNRWLSKETGISAVQLGYILNGSQGVTPEKLDLILGALKLERVFDREQHWVEVSNIVRREAE